MRGDICKLHDIISLWGGTDGGIIAAIVAGKVEIRLGNSSPDTTRQKGM